MNVKKHNQVDGPKTALITGASSGIGYELTKLFAQDGYNLVLAARSKQSLKLLAGELTQKHAISVKVLAKDLAMLKSPEEIFKDEPIKGNWIRLILNKQFDFADLNRILSVINEHQPKEPCLVDYDFSLNFEGSTETVPDADSLKASKLKYIIDYINGLDDQVFENNCVEKDTVIHVAEKYYRIAEEQIK